MTAESALTVSPAVSGAVEVYERLNPVRNALAPDLNDQELSLFAMVAHRSGLDPFARQIHAVKRSGRVTFQTGIDGYRSIAERTGEYLGSDEPEFGPWVDKPFGHPEWARVTVYRLRQGVRTPQAATAYFDEYCPADSAPMWKKMPRNQLAKCAEALALRKAFPYLFSDVYTDTEMEQAGHGSNDAVAVAAQAPTARERLAARRAALEAAPESASENTAAPGPSTVESEPEDGSFTEVAPEPGPAAEPGRCAAASPYEAGSEPCAREAGHTGNHKNHQRESWSAA